MLTCDICGKDNIKTAQGLAGHLQFAHKQLSTGDPARSSATLATEDLLYQRLDDLEVDLESHIEQLEQRLLLRSKDEMLKLLARLQPVEIAVPVLVQLLRSVSALALHLDMHQRGEGAPPANWLDGLEVDGVKLTEGIAWWKEDIYEAKRAEVLEALKIGYDD